MKKNKYNLTVKIKTFCPWLIVPSIGRFGVLFLDRDKNVKKILNLLSIEPP